MVAAGCCCAKALPGCVDLDVFAPAERATDSASAAGAVAVCVRWCEEVRGGGSMGGPEEEVEDAVAAYDAIDAELVASCCGWARGVKLDVFDPAGEC